MDSEKSVLVAVRSRPLLKKGDEHFNTGLVFSQQEVAVQEKAFSFDFVFPPDATNLQVYNTAVASRLPRVFEGYNLTIFAYGQTGSGKTYTMGTNYPPVLQNESGIIFLSVTRIFEDIKLHENECSFAVKVSFLEVYKEDVYDLLSKNKKTSMCQIREDFDGVKVVNLTEVPVSCVDEVLSVLEQGCQSRSTASTAMNEHSSRSHSLFIISIEQVNKENFETKKSKFQLVDLAGSERVDQSKTEGLRFKEGVDINKGLLALGKVIAALSEGKSHIPYRDSRLTRLLMDSLGGNSYTLMIACVSPSAKSSDETLSTLRYASRARKIKNRPIINNDPPDIQIQKLKSQVEFLQAQLYKKTCGIENVSGMEEFSELREQNKNLRNQLKKLRISSQTEEPAKDSSPLGSQLSNISSGSETSDEEEVNSDLEVADIDRKIEKVELKLLKKQEIAQQFQVLTDVIENSSTQSLNILQEKVDSLQKEKYNLELALKNSEKMLCEERNKRYKECQSEIKALEKEILKNKLFQKIKEENKMKMDNLQKEIQSLKSMKVKLLKKIKVENEQFKRMELAKIREMEKMKKNERKKDFEILKLRNNFDKQVNAFKQKIEKCQSLNKRLNEALLKQRNSHLILVDKKIAKQNIETFLTKEIEIESLKQMASSEYTAAKENMGHLKDEAHNIQLASTEAEAGSSSDPLFVLSLEAEKLGKEKPVQNDPSPEEKKLVRWKTINSMTDAKIALNVLFEKCVEDFIKRNSDNGSSKEQKIAERKNKELVQERKNLLAQIKLLKDKMLKLEKEMCEKDLKIIQYLKSLNDYEKCFVEHQSDSDLIEKIKSQFHFQKIEIEELLQKVEDYDALKKKAEFWREECRQKMTNSGNRRYMSGYVNASNLETSNRTRSMIKEYLDEESGEDSFQLIDDDVHDPDFRMTPLHRQRKRTFNLMKESDESSLVKEDSEVPVKRSFTACSCPGDCRTMRCACKKKEKMCDSTCNCNHDICINFTSKETS